jgi:hypothetical protein
MLSSPHLLAVDSRDWTTAKSTSPGRGAPASAGGTLLDLDRAQVSFGLVVNVVVAEAPGEGVGVAGRGSAQLRLSMIPAATAPR